MSPQMDSAFERQISRSSRHVPIKTEMYRTIIEPREKRSGRLDGTLRSAEEILTPDLVQPNPTDVRRDL